MRIEGAPRYHISTLLQTPLAFLVLSSHAYSALGRFLIFPKVTIYSFASLLFSAFFAVRLSLALLAWFFRTKILDDFWPEVNLQILRATMWLQVEEVARTEIHWLKACASHFQTSVGYPAFSMSQSETFLIFPMAKYAWNAICWCQVRINCHMVLSKFQPFDHPQADVLD